MSTAFKVALAALGLAVALIGCNQKRNDDTHISPNTNSCSVGYVYSSTYGCLPQAGCPAGYGSFNNQCVIATSGTSCPIGQVYSAQYGCLSQGNCPTGYALYNNQCMYVGSTTMNCPMGTMLSGNQCVATNGMNMNSCQGSCPMGSVQTQYGCLPQGQCTSCYGYQNRYCISATSMGPQTWYMSPY